MEDGVRSDSQNHPYFKHEGFSGISYYINWLDSLCGSEALSFILPLLSIYIVSTPKKNVIRFKYMHLKIKIKETILERRNNFVHYQDENITASKHLFYLPAS